MTDLLAPFGKNYARAFHQEASREATGCLEECDILTYRRMRVLCSIKTDTLASGFTVCANDQKRAIDEMHTIHRVRIDHNGCLPIPAEVCAEMGLVPGTTVAVEASNAQVICLRIVSDEAAIVEENGIRVIASQSEEAMDTFLEGERESRMASVASGLDL